MSEGILIAIIGVIGTVLGAIVSSILQHPHGIRINRSWIVISAISGMFAGLAIGVIITQQKTPLTETTPIYPSQISAQIAPSTYTPYPVYTVPTIPPTTVPTIPPTTVPTIPPTLYQTTQPQTITPTDVSEILEISHVTASSFSPDGNPEKAVDGQSANGSYGWFSAKGETIGAWIQLDFRISKVVTNIQFRTTAQANDPKDIRLLFSDGTTQDIHLRAIDGIQNCEISPVSTNSIRFIIDSVNNEKDNNWDYVAIMEISVFGR